jgi:outer membrane murein-binding lipoprotein Lpp
MGYTALFGRSNVLSAALVFGCVALFGCGSTDHLKKQVASLETQLTAVRADQDRLEERLAAVELTSTVPPRTAANRPTDRVDHPRLKVIHLSPEDDATAPTEPTDETSTSPNKGAPSRRPIIRGTGDRVIKANDAEGDESTKNDDATGSPVAELRREPHRN